MKLQIYDSTLRDGAQAESVSFSIADKIKIIQALDDFGVDFIEAGQPAANPKDNELYNMLKDIKLKHSKIAAFGSTRKCNINAFEDDNLIGLVNSDTEVVTIFGKSWDLHVTKILSTTLEENLNMIKDSITFLKENGKTVFYDAEHFFDGYKANSDYALKTIITAEKAGADSIILCDTNGGCFPDEIYDITTIAKSTVSVPLGIHCHNDTGCAAANAIFAVKAGASQVQGTFTGIGERCGNTNLSVVIPSFQIKLGINCVEDEKMPLITSVSRYIAEISNSTLNDTMPYVGCSAFSHKAGMHVNAVSKVTSSFEHISPELVGNKRNYLLSEVSGRTTLLNKVKNICPYLTKDSDELIRLMKKLKEQEHKGYSYEAAQASFELLVLKFLGRFEEFFHIAYFKVIGEQADSLQKSASAMVKVIVKDNAEMSADEGDGPVNAMDKALRSALAKFYPQINEMQLIDYKVRVMNSVSGSASVVRVLIESTDGNDVWTTVGASYDIINASVNALVDSIEYKLLKDKNQLNLMGTRDNN